MASYNVPTTQSQMILDTAGQVCQVIVQNTGAVNVAMATDQGYLDSSVPVGGGFPANGFVLFPNLNPVTIDKFNGKLWIRAGAVGGKVECVYNPVC